MNTTTPCPDCRSPLTDPLLPEQPVTCARCRASLLLHDDGSIEVLRADGESFEVAPEVLDAVHGDDLVT